jgi:hypothetical protein
MPRKKSPAYKMKGFSGFGNSPAKQKYEKAEPAQLNVPIPQSQTKENLTGKLIEKRGKPVKWDNIRKEYIPINMPKSKIPSTPNPEMMDKLEKKSPAKVSDDKLLELQGELNHSELDFKEPGWAKIAGKIHGGAMNIAKGALGGMAGGGGGGAPDGVVSAAQKAAQTDLE